LEKAQKELDEMGVKFTRKDYLEGRVGHQEYYEQFVTPEVIGAVLMRIGKQAILNSRDPHFNDIHLHKWGEAGTEMYRGVALSNMFTQNPETAVPSLSLSDKVCVEKAAARMIRESEAGKEK